jgi:predicted DNA-binding protein with PD1-like motif
MGFASLSLGDIYIPRIDTDKDVLELVRGFLQEANVRQAVVLGGLGACYGR